MNPKGSIHGEQLVPNRLTIDDGDDGDDQGNGGDDDGDDDGDDAPQNRQHTTVTLLTTL